MFHYSDATGFKAIVSQPVWTFVAVQPPGGHPFGAYFTTLTPKKSKLAQRHRIPKAKLEYVLEFADNGDLLPLPGGRGEYVFYNPDNYAVEKSRQRFAGRTVDYAVGARNAD